MSHVTCLKCVTCDREYHPDEMDYTCPECGPIRGTLTVRYDFERVSEERELSKEALLRNHNFTHWRYLPLLPVADTRNIQKLVVGWTPIYQAEPLEREWGVQRLWLKDDTRNPTASYKDRASSVAVVKALEKGAKTVTAASTGNAASSWAAFTCLANLKTVIFVPHNTPKAKLTQLHLYGAKVIKVNGTYDDAFDLCCSAAEKWGWYNRSTAVNPYLSEGKKTGAFEICEQLDWNVPDYVFIPTGDGCILESIWKGFKEFYDLMLIEKLPKIVGVQAEGSAPLAKAWQAGTKELKPLRAETIADSICVGVPRDQVKALAAVRESGGHFMTVSDAEILSAIKTLARRIGILAEPAGAAGLAGVKKQAEQGILGAKDTVAVLVTGHGLKDIDGVMQAVKDEAVEVDNDLDDVAEKLGNR